MALWPFVFIFCGLNLFASCEVQVENASNTFDSRSSEIAAVLAYLNSQSFRVYNYKEATLLHAHAKADITELALDVKVECLHNYPIPCAGKILTCHAFVRNAPDEGSRVLNDVNCKPKPEIVVEEASQEPPTSPSEAEISETKSIALSNEAVSSEVNEPFVAVRRDMVPCLGCPFDLNPNAEGVDELIDLALEHVASERPNKQALVKVLKLQQQVVSGVKYILVVELGPTVCTKDSSQDLTSCPIDSNSESSICQITYLQKPWISKAKHIISNNCTTSQEYVKSDSKKTEMSNEIDINSNQKPSVSTPNFDHFAETGTLEEIPPARLGDLESQIVLDVEDSSPKMNAESVQGDLESVVPSTVLTQTQIAPKVESVDPTPEIPEATTLIQSIENSSESKKGSEEGVEPAETSTGSNLDEGSRTIIESAELAPKKSSEASVEPVEASTVSNLDTESRTKIENSDSSESAESKSKKSSEESVEPAASSTVSNLDKIDSSESAESKSKESAESAEASTVSNLESGSRKKRAIPQLEKISADEKPLVKNLADFAAAALDNIDDDNHKRIILQILGAKKMVGDDGVYYHLIMRMGVSRCLEDKPPNPYENCREKLFENYTKICKVQVFVNDDFGSPKVVKSQCQNIKRDKNDSNRTNYSRFKRQVFGGPQELDKNSETVTKLFKEGIDHLNGLRKVNKHKPVEVVSATSQVVAGVLYRIQTKIVESDCPSDDARQLEDCKVQDGAKPKACEIKVWEKGWENFKQFTIKCDGEDQEYKKTTTVSRRKRDILPLEMDKDSETVTRLLNDGVAQLNGQGSVNKHKPLEVISATSQDVAPGVEYRIRANLVESDCPSNDRRPLEDCKVPDGAKPKECEIKVWEKKLERFKQFTIKCDGEDREVKVTTRIGRRKRSTPKGAPKEIDKNGETVTRLLNDGITELNAQRSVNKHKPVEVVSATSQVVAGTLYRIRTKIAESDCPSDDPRQLEDCKVQDDAKRKECEIQVWEKGWENFKQFTIKCDGEEQEYKKTTTISRRKRDTLGGPAEIDKNSETVTRLLNDGVAQLNAQRSVNKHKPVEVVSATSQVVSGLLYRIRTKVAESDCPPNDVRQLSDCKVLEGAKPKECEIKVWEKSWQNFKQFTIKCEGDEQKYKSTTTFSRRRRQIGGVPGGQSSVAHDDEDVRKYLESGLSHLDAQSDHENKYKVHEVLSATSQVVAGHIYRIQANIILSDCKKTSTKKRHLCGTSKGATPKTCQFKVYDQPWVAGSRQTNITCDDESYSFRRRRDVQFKKSENHDDNRELHFTLFMDFIKKYDKTYTKKEFKHRLKVFSENLLRIKVLNTYEQGTAQYGVTQFADVTPAEFSKRLGLRTDLRDENETPFAEADIPDVELPTEFDWRQKGVVTPVKNQEQCGSCWAFSVTGNVEGQYALKHGNLVQFSEQELVDCDTEDQGCNGGLMDTAYRQIEKLGGLETEQDYPYDAEDEKCHFNRTLARVQLSGALNISQDETEMAKWLVGNGPISIAINANAMQFYFGGVSHPFKFLCSPKNLDHGVLIVGYGVHTYPLFNKTLPYWIVKNSWGPSWGEQGYYRVYRGDGTCGLNQTPSSAIVV